MVWEIVLNWITNHEGKSKFYKLGHRLKETHMRARTYVTQKNKIEEFKWNFAAHSKTRDKSKKNYLVLDRNLSGRINCIPQIKRNKFCSKKTNTNLVYLIDIHNVI